MARVAEPARAVVRLLIIGPPGTRAVPAHLSSERGVSIISEARRVRKVGRLVGSSASPETDMRTRADRHPVSIQIRLCAALGAMGIAASSALAQDTDKNKQPPPQRPAAAGSGKTLLDRKD